MIASNNIRFYSLLAVVLLIAATVRGQEKALTSLKVSFRIKNAGIGVDGSFGKALGFADLQAGDPSASRFRGEVEAASIETGIGMRNQHLRKEEYFDVDHFPLLRMQSVQVDWVQGKYRVTWDITMKGQTRRVKSEVAAMKQEGLWLLETEFTLNRRDWGIGGSSLTMADQVKVTVQGVLKP